MSTLSWPEACPCAYAEAATGVGKPNTQSCNWFALNCTPCTSPLNEYAFLGKGLPLSMQASIQSLGGVQNRCSLEVASTVSPGSAGAQRVEGRALAGLRGPPPAGSSAHADSGRFRLLHKGKCCFGVLNRCSLGAVFPGSACAQRAEGRALAGLQGPAPASFSAIADGGRFRLLLEECKPFCKIQGAMHAALQQKACLSSCSG